MKPLQFRKPDKTPSAKQQLASLAQKAIESGFKITREKPQMSPRKSSIQMAAVFHSRGKRK